ncbi:unnamed protein product [Pieris macdunnoughi]|uniref:AP complex mu/sigma subunit domain-containing protein n=1 Tax=Pieris macdunnoughi TaxID=345717 RepID=A0A821YFG2_9NEOP|nr:unnamed protein product [Pieris macdunnoughi]
MQQEIIKETFQLVSKRDDNVCIFLDGGSRGPSLALHAFPGDGGFLPYSDFDYYLSLATVNGSSVFLKMLDKCFENVCELDLIFHADATQQVLDDLVMGGMVLQTNMVDILYRLYEQNKMQKAESRMSLCALGATSEEHCET